MLVAASDHTEIHYIADPDSEIYGKFYSITILGPEILIEEANKLKEPVKIYNNYLYKKFLTKTSNKLVEALWIFYYRIMKSVISI